MLAQSQNQRKQLINWRAKYVMLIYWWHACACNTRVHIALYALFISSLLCFSCSIKINSRLCCLLDCWTSFFSIINQNAIHSVESDVFTSHFKNYLLFARPKSISNCHIWSTNAQIHFIHPIPIRSAFILYQMN